MLRANAAWRLRTDALLTPCLRRSVLTVLRIGPRWSISAFHSALWVVIVPVAGYPLALCQALSADVVAEVKTLVYGPAAAPAK